MKKGKRRLPAYNLNGGNHVESMVPAVFFMVKHHLGGQIVGKNYENSFI